jgi:hypothetical protein
MVYKIRSKVNGLFYKAGIWQATKEGKIWTTIGRVKSALAGRSVESVNQLEVIEYELVERKRYKIVEKERVDKWKTKVFDLVDDSSNEKINVQPPDVSSPDWSKI